MSSNKFIARNGLAVGTTPVDIVDSTGTILVNAPTATKLQTARTISLSGDVAGSVSFDGSGNAAITTTIQPDSVALGTDTTGNYMVNVAAGTGVSVSHTQGEGSTATVSIGQPVGTTDNVTFNSVTVNGTLTSDDITSTNISIAGNATITGNLTVSGTTTTVNSTTIALADANLELARNATTAAQANGAGITVTGPTTPATFTYTSADDRWNLNKNLNVGTVYGNISGTAGSETLATVTARGNTTSTSIQVDYITTTNNGNGTNVRIGDDVWIGDVNTAHTMRVAGVSDNTKGYIIFGNGDSTALGRSGTGALTYGGNTVYHSGNLTNLNQLTNGPGYITGESDTLATVTARGASTSTAVTLSSGSNHYQGHFYYDSYDAAGNHYPHFKDGSNNGGVTVNWRLYTGATNSITHQWTISNTDFVNNVRTPILYDYNDTGYYVDPNSKSRLNDSHLTSLTAGTRNNTSTFGGNGTGLTASFSLEVRASAAPPALTWHYENVATRHIALDSSGFLQVLNPGESGGSVLQANNSLRAPVFYDSNDTTYYGDFASTNWGVYSAGGGRFRNIQISDSSYTDTIQHVTSGGNLWLQYGHAGNVGLVYGGGKVGIGGISSPSAKLHVQVAAPSGAQAVNSAASVVIDNTGNNFLQFRNSADNNSYQGLIFSDNNQGGYVVFGNAGGAGDMLRLGGYNSISFDVGTDDSTSSVALRTQRGYIDSSSNLFAFGSMRSPIFYDYNDTGYYCDPNSTSNFNYLTLGGRNMRSFEHNSFVEFYVEGDANTYYPVRFDVSAWMHWGRWSISRGYGDTAPWDPIGTGVHHGGLTFTWEWSGDGAWGGNDHNVRVVEWSEQYTTMIGGMNLSVNGMIVWLRGGHAYYRFHGPGGMTNGVTAYYTTYTASNGATFAPRSNASSAAGEINYRYPVRGSGSLYDGGNWVLHENEWQNDKYFGSDGLIYCNQSRPYIMYDRNDTGYYVDPAGGNARISRDLYISGYTGGNYGNRLIVGNTDTSYTLQDGNLRPTIQVHGQYPVLSLNHTVTSNTSHGPTVQFTANGTGKQFVIGMSGNGSQLDIGFSAATDWNPHNGIASYNGTTGWRMDNSGNTYSYISDRSPIFYDNSDTGYYADPNSTSVLNNVTINGTLRAYANPVRINRIDWVSGDSQASDPYCLRWRSETDSGTGSLSWLELQMNDDQNEEFRIYGYSCSGYGCGQISGNLYHRFDSSGNAWHAGNVTAYSDARVKENISIIDNAIDKVMQIRGVTFTRNDRADTTARHAGVIAQEVEVVLPEVVTTDEYGMKSVAYGNMVGLLIEAIKEQQKQIEELKGIINEIRG